MQGNISIQCSCYRRKKKKQRQNTSFAHMETCTRLENPAHLSYTVQTAVLRTDGCDIIPSPYQLAQCPEVTQNKSRPPHAATARMTCSNCERQTLNSTGWKKLWVSAKRKQRWWLSDRTLGGWMRGSGVFRLWVEVHVLTDKLIHFVSWELEDTTGLAH